MSLLSDIKLSRAPFAAFVAMGLFWGAFAALAPVLKERIGANDAEFGTALLCAALGACMAMLLAPRADRSFGRFAMVVLALAFGLATVGPGLATGVVAFGAAMLVMTALSGTLDVVMNARLSQIEAEAQRPLMNLNHGFYSLAYAVSALLAGFGRELGFGPVAILSAVAAGILALCLFMVQRKSREGAADAKGDGLPMALIWVAGIIILIAFLAEQATEQWSALHLERTLNGGPAQGAMGPAILGLTMGIGRLSGQLVAARFHELTVLRWAGVVAAFGALLAAIAPALWVGFLGFAVLGLGVSVVAPMAIALVGRRVSDDIRTSAVARVTVIGYSGFFLGPPMMGFVAQGFGLGASFATIGALLAIMALPLVAMLRRR